jgi:vacuolar-type H+-ATPase subunit E/Vma4
MDDSRLEKLERRMEELDQRSSAMERAMEKAMDRSRAAMDSMLPRETRRHLRAAGREQLLAVRSLLDYWVEKMGEKPAKDDGESNSGRENIPID